MTPQEQRIAIAEFCGWKKYIPDHGIESYLFYNPDLGELIQDSYSADMLPNYPNDLNAMHEAEKLLSGQQWSDYVVMLERNYLSFPIWKEMNPSTAIGIGCVHATSQQRSEAFLRTIGKWQ